MWDCLNFQSVFNLSTHKIYIQSFKCSVSALKLLKKDWKKQMWKKKKTFFKTLSGVSKFDSFCVLTMSEAWNRIFVEKSECVFIYQYVGSWKIHTYFSYLSWIWFIIQKIFYYIVNVEVAEKSRSSWFAATKTQPTCEKQPEI